MDWFKARDAHFLGLQTAVFCVACELISENNTPHCLACGSQALISLSRVLGGSLRRQQTAHLIADAELDRLVHDLIRTVPVTTLPVMEDHLPVSFASLAQSDSGISADCVRTGQVVLCHDAQDDPHVDVAVCQRLGVRSILAAPLRHFRRTLGVFEVFSAAPHAFAERDVATMQLLSSVMVAALSRLSPLRQTA